MRRRDEGGRRRIAVELATALISLIAALIGLLGHLHF
jgi:hypothetical protein